MKILNVRLRRINLFRYRIVTQITKVLAHKNKHINIHNYLTEANALLTYRIIRPSIHLEIKKQRSSNQERLS
jgi:hypothetical protein